MEKEKIEREEAKKKERIQKNYKEFINIKLKGKESSNNIVHIVSNDSFLDSNIFFKSVNRLNTST